MFEAFMCGIVVGFTVGISVPVIVGMIESIEFLSQRMKGE